MGVSATAKSKWARYLKSAIAVLGGYVVSETPGIYNVGDRPLRPQPPPTFEIQVGSLPPAVRSVAESLALRDIESAKRYVALFLSGNRGGKQ
jgi:hypothetical protein